jgi:undecaprenyl-diphosphatase
MTKKKAAKTHTPFPADTIEAMPQNALLTLLAGFLAAVVSLLLFADIAEDMLEGSTKHFDAIVRGAVHAQSSPFVTPFMQLFTFLGSTLFIAIATAASSIMFWRTGRKHRCVLMLITVIGAAILMLVLKYSFHRPRPEPFFDTPLPPFNSFPSGHSMVSFCFYAALAALSAANEDSRKKRIAIWAVSLALVSMIGLSRIYLGVHWPTDVLSAYLAAAVWVTSVAFAYHGWKHRQHKKKLKSHS